MTSQSIFCTATSRAQAEDIVDRLKSADFSAGDISVLFPDKNISKQFVQEKHTKAPEGTVAGAGTGGVIGGALGWLMGIGSLAIPGAGPFIAAGPIMAALGGAAIGGAVGGLTGALIGLGIPEIEAKHYEGRLHEGRVFISAHTNSSQRIETAKRIFKEGVAQDISYSQGVAAQMEACS